jgi:biotin operon repressor
MELEVKIIEAMKAAQKPLSAGQIAELLGVDRKLVDKAMKNLKTEAKIVSPKNCFWEPAK